MQTNDFVAMVWDYYAKHGRYLPWRITEPDGSFDPYKILVSEIMLQQTQVSRVVPKYQEFLQAYPTVRELAKATLGDVLQIWSGLGYNRRAKFLWQAAQKVVSDYKGVFAEDQKELIKLPGVGINTAGAICAYAFSQPVVFIETNIRTTFIHHFFEDREDVSDAELLPLLQQTVNQENPREWYWALMDYGSHLKTTVGNASRSSKHYAKQSKFEGSRRQIRGQILKTLVTKECTLPQLTEFIPDQRLPAVLKDLKTEGLITLTKSHYHLS